MRLPILAVIAASLLSSCQGVIVWGNLVVLALSVGIFMGTISLGRPRD